MIDSKLGDGITVMTFHLMKASESISLSLVLQLRAHLREASQPGH